MNKKTFCIALLSVMMFCACQPTPEKEPVSYKDPEQMLEAAAADSVTFECSEPEDQEPSAARQPSVSSAVIPPEDLHVNKSVESPLTDVKITIDADVVLPSADRIPIVRIKKNEYDSDRVKTLHRVLCGGLDEAVQLPSWYYQAQLNLYLEQKASGVLDDLKYSSPKELDSAIEEQRAKAAAAPEYAVTKELDFSAYRKDSGFDHHFAVENGHYVSWLFINMYNNAEYTRDILASAMDYQIAEGNPLRYLKPEIDQQTIPVSLPQIDETAAKAIAEQTIRDLGLSDFVCSGERLAPLSEYNANTKAAIPCIYEFLYTRQIDGVPILFTNNGASSKIGDPNSYSATWHYERIRVFVDDGGVYSLLWYGPYEILETVTASSALLPFDQVLESFERMIVYKYPKAADHRKAEPSILINRIQLGLTRILDKDNPGYGYLVPAWVFYGIDDTTTQYAYGVGHDGFQSILIINAVDGSVIDPAVGY